MHQAGHCEDNKWDYNCTQYCPDNCDSDCDKESGDCYGCKSGYRQTESNRKCHTECPPLTYGIGCNASCIEKCGTECTENIEGTCPTGFSYLWLIMPFIVPSVIMGIYFVKTNFSKELNSKWMQVKKRVQRKTGKGKKESMGSTYASSYSYSYSSSDRSEKMSQVVHGIGE
ncbi:hypothetical protein Btru_016184 [Bulinus truncatus]|nr:hypothetical protein Btru_016184 [Bulinus truncatus]